MSSIYGLWWGLATSLASALAFNFFFLPPAHTLVIDSSSDWLALAAFAVTAVVTSDLAARERRGREEAARRAEEARLGERFATVIATAANLDDALAGLGDEAARTLGAESGVIVRGPAATGGAHALPLELNGRPIGELRLSGGGPELLSSPASMRIARQLAGLIALGEERERRMREQVNAEALLRSDELKTALLRAVSHDLRSPLQAIAAASGGLRFAALDDDEQELLDTIGAESSRMSRMIENLLDLSRLNAGALPPAADWLDPRELVEAAVAELFRGEPQTRIRVEVAADVPLVRGDGPQLQRVVVNVVENALKFSRADQRGRGARRPARRSVVEIAVRDHGPGVASEDARADLRALLPRRPHARRARIGARPRDRPRARSRQRRGAVGLSRRRPTAAGSTFVLELPAAGVRRRRERRAADPRRRRRAPDPAGARGDAHEGRLPGRDGGGAAETLTAAALSPPDLVILDLMLPDGDGADVCAELRDWLTAPILLISAVQDEPDKIRALDAGADDYLTKPFGVGELLARVRALLRRSDGAAPGDRVVEVGRLSIDLPRRVVTVAGAEIHLTPTEFDLLKELALAAGRPLTHQMLLRKVWGPGYAQEMQLLRTHMGRLRDKLEAGGIPRDAIETLTGVGYRLRDPAVMPT